MYRPAELSHYYKILEVEQGAGWGEIHRAYHRASLKAHPDRRGSHADMLAVSTSTSPFCIAGIMLNMCYI
jgi:curved DNA-binding protein CbpA